MTRSGLQAAFFIKVDHMYLPQEKLEQVEYYECYTGETSYEADGKPIQEDIIILHLGEWVKEWKLFGFVVWSKTVEDRTKKFVFKRNRNLKNVDEGIYSFLASKEFKELRAQLEAYVDNEFYEVYKELHDHEIRYVTS